VTSSSDPAVPAAHSFDYFASKKKKKKKMKNRKRKKKALPYPRNIRTLYSTK
jgi:hypothetical protein